MIKAGWAYGGGRALEGKEFMLAVSTGSPADSYTREGSHVRTMEELLSPFETTFRHTHATYLKPFLIKASLRPPMSRSTPPWRSIRQR